MITQELEFHPIADGYPLASPTEYDALQENIRQYGLISPIILYNGKILDGRNRYIACRESDVEPRYETFTGTYEEAFRYSNSLNATRRHLNKGQKAMVAAKAVLDTRNNDNVKNLSLKLASEIYGVSDKYIQRAMDILEKNPNGAEAVFSGAAMMSQVEKSFYEEHRNEYVQSQEERGLKMNPDSVGFTVKQMQRYQYLNEQEKFSLIKMIMEMEGTIS